ncbi:TetR family transcriptional regulator C-terminal domain-containing protein [Novosphingobium sp. G106]|uniref:TetR/AcrR family transcriptional regulator n=1 Tax=Novosphingobium sp. G106 TaxID=2849500 RepID=UPI001C2DDB4C|nr:TetR family transcriptional regulator C-terminal domain-containing protein [Novosphingobium sp. G106]MBV1687172.1 TetR family transcriptional regulator C-terminal domain-containing protein [Novosphingobium sp. G106]
MAIDHEQRRADIATITIDIIASDGLEAATFRRIAAEAGFSTTAITHYFADKQELLVWAFHILSQEGVRRFREALSENPSDLIGALLTMVPWCPINVRRWKAFLALWDQASRDQDIAHLVRLGESTGYSIVHELLRGEASGKHNLEIACKLLHAMIQGLSLQMLVDEKNWDEPGIRSLLEDAFNVAVLKARSP